MTPWLNVLQLYLHVSLGSLIRLFDLVQHVESV
ncbi:hypothetical protein PF003_g1206 [Phytophthora fragariae]|nr:hypothetical protein PF003_g1206 [Phytophthora fragariae]